jgi:DNA repair protein RadC
MRRSEVADTGIGYRIKDIEESQRPRERLAKLGPGVLTDAELLAILLRVGKKGASALQIGQRLLFVFEGLTGLQKATFTELCNVEGVGPAKAAQLKAAVEVGRRLAREAPKERVIITGPQDVADQVQYKMGHLDQEELWVLLLDSRNQLIRIEQLYRGTLNSSSVRPAEIFRTGIRHNAAALIVVHNHPSGDPAPSPEDVQLTRTLIDAGHLIEMPVLDHVVVGIRGTISIKSLHPDLW